MTKLDIVNYIMSRDTKQAFKSKTLKNVAQTVADCEVSVIKDIQDNIIGVGLVKDKGDMTLEVEAVITSHPDALRLILKNLELRFPFYKAKALRNKKSRTVYYSWAKFQRMLNILTERKELSYGL